MNKFLHALTCMAFVAFFAMPAQGQATLWANIFNTPNITLALFGIPTQDGEYYKASASGLNLYHYTNGKTFLRGTLINKNNPGQRWKLNFEVTDQMSGTEWLQWGEMTQMDDGGCNPQVPADMVVFTILPGVSTLVGEGDFDGKTLVIEEMDLGNGPKKNMIQFGDKAGVINCGDGAAAWFAFGGSYSGTADFYGSATLDPGIYPQSNGTPCTFVNSSNITLALMWIPNQSSPYYMPGVDGLNVYPDGPNRLKIEGEIVNKANPNQRFMVRYFLINPKSAAQWAAEGQMLMMDSDGCMTPNTDTYVIYEIESGTSVLQGTGDFDGIDLSVYEMDLGGMPKKNFAQIGDGAGVINCGLGIAMWYAFQGGNITGTSDFYSSLDCPNNFDYVNRCDAQPGASSNAVLNIKTANGNRKYVAGPAGLEYITYPDGSAAIVGEVVNRLDPNDTWMVQLPMSNPVPASVWLANPMHFTHTNCPTADQANWQVFEPGVGTYTGTGSNAGLFLNVTTTMGYGYQLGEGASGKCGNGLGTWVRYSGSFKAKGDIHLSFANCGFEPCGTQGQPACTAGGSTPYTMYEAPETDMTNAVGLRDGALYAFPNPAFGDKLNVVVEGIEDANGIVTITDMSGRVISTQQTTLVSGQAMELQIGAFSTGTYIISVTSENNAPMNTLFVKR